MATIDIDIDIEDYIDEIDDYFLIKELKRRANNKTGKKELAEAFKELQEDGGEEVAYWPEIKTLDDKLRRDWVNENWERIPL